MAETPEKKSTEFSLLQLLPNVLTITAICAGLSSIQLGVQGHHMLAVQLVLVACVLDGLDGKIARLLGSDSKMGAELDSLADFLNFGVAPPLILYFWGLQDYPGIGWMAMLIFAVCCVIRLARFNVSSKSEHKNGAEAFFVGVPAPAGALLVMMPLYVSFAFPDAAIVPETVISAFAVFIGMLMISTIPTYSFKAIKLSRENVKYFLVGVAFAVAAVLTFAWLSMIVLALGYLAIVIWAWLASKLSSTR